MRGAVADSMLVTHGAIPCKATLDNAAAAGAAAGGKTVSVQADVTWVRMSPSGH